MATFAQHLEIESYTLYAIGVLLIAARMYVHVLVRLVSSVPLTQRLTASPENYCSDHGRNWRLMTTLCSLCWSVCAWECGAQSIDNIKQVTFTGVTVSVNQVAQNLSNYLAPGVAETLTPTEVQNAIFGSKFVFILEEFQLTTTWLVKACLLLLYRQITMGLKQTLVVKIVAVYCVVGYFVVQILFLGVWCRPIQQYWWVPVKNRTSFSLLAQEPHLGHDIILGMPLD